MDSDNNKLLVKPRASSYISNMKKYDKYRVDRDITRFTDELQRQVAVAKEYDGDSDQLITRCRDFFHENQEIIAEQHRKMTELNQYLKRVITENKRNAEINGELNDLVNSEEYLSIVDKMQDIKRSIQDLDEFLDYHD